MFLCRPLPAVSDEGGKFQDEWGSPTPAAASPEWTKDVVFAEGRGERIRAVGAVEDLWRENGLAH